MAACNKRVVLADHPPKVCPTSVGEAIMAIEGALALEAELPAESRIRVLDARKPKSYEDELAELEARIAAAQQAEIRKELG